MADTWWDKAVDFAYQHGPKWLMEKIDTRDFARDVSEQYDLYLKREAAGVYAEPIVHPDTAREAAEAQRIYAQQEREEQGRADMGFQSRDDGPTTPLWLQEYDQNIRAAPPQDARPLMVAEPDYQAMMEDNRMIQSQTYINGMDDNDRLHRDPRDGPAKETVTQENWGDGYGQTNRTELYVVHGDLVARAELESGSHEEGSWHRERWHDPAGQLHSFNGNPAEIIYSNHSIPSESYLDESVHRFYEHGKEVNSVDRTYDDISVQKPLSVRQAFGEDLDGVASPVTPEPTYPGRFDVPAPSNELEVREGRHDEIARKLREVAPSGPEAPAPAHKPTQSTQYVEEHRYHEKTAPQNVVEFKPQARDDRQHSWDWGR